MGEKTPEIRNLFWQRIIAAAAVAAVVVSILANKAMYDVAGKSADAARDSAQAAKVSADAIREQINLQRETTRARIEFGDIPPPPVWPTDVGPQQSNRVEVPWHIEYRNVGRGTATEIWAFVAVNWMTGPGNDCWGSHPEGLAEKYVRKETWKRPLTPGDKEPLLHYLFTDISEQRWTTVNMQPVVYYRDEFGVAHETAITISYQPGDRVGEYSTQICRKGTWAK